MYSMKRSDVAACRGSAARAATICVVVHAALDDRVDLDRQARRRRAASIPSSTRATGKSTSFIARNVASSSESRLTVTRCRPASASACAFCGSSDAVRRQRQVDAELGEHRDQPLEVAAHQRLAAGQAELLDAERDEDPRERA